MLQNEFRVFMINYSEVQEIDNFIVDFNYRTLFLIVRLKAVVVTLYFYF